MNHIFKILKRWILHNSINKYFHDLIHHHIFIVFWHNYTKESIPISCIFVCLCFSPTHTEFATILLYLCIFGSCVDLAVCWHHTSYYSFQPPSPDLLILNCPLSELESSWNMSLRSICLAIIFFFSNLRILSDHDSLIMIQMLPIHLVMWLSCSCSQWLDGLAIFRQEFPIWFVLKLSRSFSLATCFHSPSYLFFGKLPLTGLNTCASR